MTHGDTEDGPIPPPVDLNEQFGNDDREVIDKIIEERVKEAKGNGLSEQGAESLKLSMTKFKFIFVVKLGSRPPAKVEPFKVQLKPGAQPIRATQRKYGPAQTAFIESTIKKLGSN